MKVQRHTQTFKIIEVLKYGTPKTDKLIARQVYGRKILKTDEYASTEKTLGTLYDLGIVDRFRCYITEKRSELFYKVTDFGSNVFDESQKG